MVASDAASSPEPMTSRALGRALLARQHLLTRTDEPMIDVIDQLVGLQAQNASSPYTALWSRVSGFRHNDLGDALVARRVARIAVMRGTIHLVTAADARALPGLLAELFLTDLARNATHAAGLRTLDLVELREAARELLEVEPLVTTELGRRLAQRWPHLPPATLAHGARGLLPLVQVPPRGVWGRSAPTTWTTTRAWLGPDADAARASDGDSGDSSSRAEAARTAWSQAEQPQVEQSRAVRSQVEQSRAVRSQVEQSRAVRSQAVRSQAVQSQAVRSQAEHSQTGPTQAGPNLAAPTDPAGAEAQAAALDELALRYLAAFGPATVGDLQKWSGLTGLGPVLDRLRPRLLVLQAVREPAGEARARGPKPRVGPEAGARSGAEPRSGAGGRLRELFDLPSAPRPDPDTPAPVRFLPDYDNVLLAHADRSRIVPEAHRHALRSPNGVLPGTVLVDGQVAGTWSVARDRLPSLAGAPRSVRERAVLTVRPLERWTAADRREAVEEAQRLVQFLADDAAERQVVVDAD